MNVKVLHNKFYFHSIIDSAEEASIESISKASDALIPVGKDDCLKPNSVTEWRMEFIQFPLSRNQHRKIEKKFLHEYELRFNCSVCVLGFYSNEIDSYYSLTPCITTFDYDYAEGTSSYLVDGKINCQSLIERHDTDS